MSIIDCKNTRKSINSHEMDKINLFGFVIAFSESRETIHYEDSYCSFCWYVFKNCEKFREKNTVKLFICSFHFRFIVVLCVTSSVPSIPGIPATQPIHSSAPIRPITPIGPIPTVPSIPGIPAIPSIPGVPAIQNKPGIDPSSSSSEESSEESTPSIPAAADSSSSSSSSEESSEPSIPAPQENDSCDIYCAPTFASICIGPVNSTDPEDFKDFANDCELGNYNCKNEIRTSFLFEFF